MIEFVRNRKKCRISKLFDLLFRGVRVNYVIYGDSQQLSDLRRKDWSVVGAGYALSLKPLLHYETRLTIDGPFPLTFLVLSILESLDASFQQIRHATIPALYIPAQTHFENYFRSC